MLSRILGLPRAIATVDVAADKLGLGVEMADDKALELLARIANEPGVVGIAARFAKTRAHLSWLSLSE